MNIVRKLPCHIPDQTSRRNVHDDLDPPLFRFSSIITLHLAFSHRQLLHDTAGILVFYKHCAFLDRFQPRSVRFAGGVALWVGNHDGLGRADRELESFAAHALEEDTEVQDSSSAQFERLRCGTWENGERDVGLRFFVDTIPDDLRGEFRALTTGERRVVSMYMDRDGGRVDWRRLEFRIEQFDMK